MSVSTIPIQISFISLSYSICSVMFCRLMKSDVRTMWFFSRWSIWSMLDVIDGFASDIALSLWPRSRCVAAKNRDEIESIDFQKLLGISNLIVLSFIIFLITFHDNFFTLFFTLSLLCFWNLCVVRTSLSKILMLTGVRLLSVDYDRCVDVSGCWCVVYGVYRVWCAM